MIGANDLAQSLGLTGRLDHPDLLAAFADIANAPLRPAGFSARWGFRPR